MARRGEGQFVAIEVNLRNDPHVLGLARRLKIHRLQAVGLLATWREFVLERGTGTGVVKGYTRAELAEFLDWPRAPAVLVDALKLAGQLAVRRGAFVHPHRPDTITGHYAHKKAADRDRKRGWRGRAQGEEGDSARATSGEVPRNGRATSGEVPSGSGQEVSNGPPGPPDPGGESEAGAPRDWGRWFLDTYPKVRNPKKIRRLLAAMEPDELAQLGYCLPIHAPRYLERQKSKGWRFVPFGDSYLEDGTFWEFRPPKPKATNGAHAAAAAADAELLAKKLDEEARREKDRERLQRRAIVIARLRDEGVAIKRTDPAFEELVEQRLEAGEGLPS